MSGAAGTACTATTRAGPIGRRSPARICAGFVCLLAVSVTIAADYPSSKPAIRSPLASTSLLVDVVAAGERLVAAGEQGHIIYSDDDGLSWTHAVVPTSLMLTSLSFPSPERGWAVGHEGIVLASTDAGENWKIQLDGRRIAALQLDQAKRELEMLENALAALGAAAGPDEREAAEFALDDARFVVEDAESVLDDGITTPLLGVEFFSETHGYAFGAYGVLLETLDAGESWGLISSRIENPADYHLYDMARTTAGVVIVTGEAGALYRSSDGGKSWQRLRTGYEGSLFGTIAAADGSVIVFGLRGNIFRSTDDGASWQAIETPAQSTLTGGALLPDQSIALVGSSGALLLSRDHGQTFAVHDTGTRSTLAGAVESRSGDLFVAGFGGVRIVARAAPAESSN